MHPSHLLKRHIALPQDHGSWVFLLSPLLIGLFAGAHFTPASAYLILACLGAFLLRQPVAVLVKTLSGRRPRTERPAAIFWAISYSIVVLGGLVGLVLRGFAFVLVLAAPGALVFAWHLWLVSRRRERRQAGVEILATGALALSAPAAYWIGVESYATVGWALWLLTWLQAAASIVYAYLRLDQKDLPADTPRSATWRAGRRALLYTSFNLVLSLALGATGWLPRWICLAFLPQWLETLWGINKPAIGWKPTAVGLRQLAVSALFTLLFILYWRLA